MSLLKKSRNRLLTRAAQNHLHRFCRVLPSRDREGAVRDSLFQQPDECLFHSSCLQWSRHSCLQFNKLFQINAIQNRAVESERFDTS
jgi:hypothetical protein